MLFSIVLEDDQDFEESTILHVKFVSNKVVKLTSNLSS